MQRIGSAPRAKHIEALLACLGVSKAFMFALTTTTYHLTSHNGSNTLYNTINYLVCIWSCASTVFKPPAGLSHPMYNSVNPLLDHGTTSEA